MLMRTKEEKTKYLKEARQKEEQYKLLRKTRKNFIKQEPNRWKRFWKLIWFYISFPFGWIWRNIRDWRTFIIFAIVFLVLSSEVWIPYILGFITWGTKFSKTMIGVGSACLFFWNCVPFTPFLPLCIVITISVKSAFNRYRFKKLDKEENMANRKTAKKKRLKEQKKEQENDKQ